MKRLGRSGLGGKRRITIALCLVALSTLVLGQGHVKTDHEDSLSLAKASASSLVESSGSSALNPQATEVRAADGTTHNSFNVQSDESENAGSSSENSYDPTLEAEKAYKQALVTLSSIPSFTQTPYSSSLLDAQPNSLLAQLFPNQQGPIASTIRIIYKLRQQTWLPSFVRTILGKDGVGGGGGSRKEEELRGKAVKIVDLLEHAVELGHMDALYKLAQVSLFHLFPLLHDTTRAFEAYSTHAQFTGNATSQAMVAFFYATGYDNVTAVDQAKALLYYTFAAHGGDQGAQMTLGYRHWAGIGVNDDCGFALDWYQMAAEQSMEKFLSGPPGGRTLLHTTTRLSDLDGGVYGPGSSVASTGPNAHRAVIKAASARQAGETWEDVLEYYMFNADRGEIDFSYRLGKIFYQGSIYALPGGAASGGEGVGAIPRDYARARSYFLRIARQIWPRDAPGTPSPPPRQELKEDGTLSFAAASAGFLGRMYLRGEGMKQDYTLAKMWFERGAEYGEKECHNGLGIIMRDGLVDGKKDMKAAVAHFMIAANQELAEAQVNLGKYQYHRGDLKLATTYFESAIRHGSPFEPYFYLAKIHAAAARNPSSPSHHVQGSCAMAVSSFKLVSERGAWGDDPVRDGEARWKLGTDRAREDAMLRWGIASERGIETAQNNLAYILDQDKSILRFTRFAPFTPSNDTARLALTQYMRSAYQRNFDALVKVGDYYFHGLGVPEEEFDKRAERAAAFYQSAVDTQVSALAMWNLGWMYENGIGVPQDFHLAKRHYDLALETNSEAYLPVVLSLVKLHVRSIWHTLMGGQNGLALWPAEEPDPSNPDQPTLSGKHRQSEQHHGASDEFDVSPQRGDEEFVDAGGDDAQWYKGKARDDHKRRMRTTAEERRLGEEEDPIEWARERRAAEERERDREGGDYDFGPEDYFDSAIRGPGRREHHQHQQNQEEVEVDDFTETMLLVGLCLLVSALMYIRGQWFERRRREEEERRRVAGGGVAGGQAQPQPQPQQNAGGAGNANANGAGDVGAGANEGGMLPPAGDPARADWAVLR
ncbi:HRD3 [Sanghuangporus weigelae]